jgi:DNA-binding NarL/FixJ family response regulator
MPECSHAHRHRGDRLMKTQSHGLEKASSRTGIRTLIVDDSPLMLKILVQILGQVDGFELVGTASDGRQALRSVLTLAPDLVLMDFHLPHLNGIQAAEYIKGFERPPVVIIITADDNSASRSMARRAGADAFVVKRGNLRVQLVATLQKLFARSDAAHNLAGTVAPNPPPAGRRTTRSQRE